MHIGAGGEKATENEGYVQVAEEYVGVWRKGVGFQRATADEIANGIYYPDHAAYAAAQAGDLSRIPREKQDGAAAAGDEAGATQ